MADDWGSKVSAITALVTIPIYASSLLVQPTFNKIRDTITRIYYRNNRCEAIQWKYLSHDPIQIHSLPHAPLTTAFGLEAGGSQGVDNNKSPKLTTMSRFLYNTWKVEPRVIPRPAYLDVAKEYLQLDADVLLAMVLLDGGYGSLGRYPDPGTRCTLGFGSTTAQFRVLEGESIFYIVGKLDGVPDFEQTRRNYGGVTKEALRAMACGYPPFYRHFIRMNSGVEVAHPIQSMRDIYRASWVLAIGFSSSTIQPLKLYDKSKLPAYSEACDRVLGTLERL